MKSIAHVAIVFFLVGCSGADEHVFGVVYDAGVDADVVCFLDPAHPCWEYALDENGVCKPGLKRSVECADATPPPGWKP